MFNVIPPRGNPYAFRRDNKVHVIHTGKGFWELTLQEARSLLEDLENATDDQLYAAEKLYAEQNKIMRQAERV